MDNYKNLQKDFELACLFRSDMFPGCFETNEKGGYTHIKVANIFEGYIMGINSTNNKLARCDAKRYVSAAMLLEFTKRHSDPNNNYSTLINCALDVAKDFPV